MKKHLLCICIILFFINNISAQLMPSFGGGSQHKIYDGKISGNVMDAGNGKPVEIANVALFKTGSEKPLDGTITDEKGTFRIKISSLENTNSPFHFSVTLLKILIR